MSKVDHPSSQKKDRILREVWYDPEDGFGSAKATLKQAVARDPTITLADVKKFLEQQESLNRKRGKALNSYIADYPCQQVQIGIADFSGEVAKGLTSLRKYADLLIRRLREAGGEMDVGKAGTFLRAREGFSDALQGAKVTRLREFLEGFTGWTIEGGRAGGKTTLKLARRKKTVKGPQTEEVDTGGAKYRYALFAVDVFSKLATVIPLNSKEPKDVVEAFSKALETFKDPVSSVYTDDGGEFQKEFATYVEKHHIQHLVTRGHAPFVERLIRAIKRVIFLRQESLPKPWHDYLQVALSKYNRSEHAATGFTPIEAHKPGNAGDVHAALVKRGKFLKKYPPLSVGDTVRVLRKAGKVGERKESWNDWDAERREVEKIEGADPKLFILNGAQRGYMRRELLKVD